jgi:predicted flap endonuclease-1-like 5' DNA nuclease
MKPDDVDLESHVGVDPDRVNERVRARFAEFVANREQRLADLRERALDAEQEASALRNRVTALQEQVESLEQRRGSAAGTDLDTESLVATFGDALSSDRISRSGFTVSDLSVDLRANVVHTEDGVRVTLPEPGSRPAPESLSELRFSVRSDPAAGEPDFDEVPALVGMAEDGAREALREAGFDVGAVDTVAADAEPGRVVDQLPSPYSLAEPGAPVDLEVAAATEEAVDLVGEAFADVVRLAGDRFSLHRVTAVDSAEPSGTVLEQDPGPGEVATGDRLSLTISAYPEPEAGLDSAVAAAGEPVEAPDETVEDDADPADESGRHAPSGRAEHRTEGDVSVAEDLLAAAADPPADVAPLVERDVEEIDGIGDTYGRRLRTAGVESLADLVVAEPVRIADAANVTDDRAREWIEAGVNIARSVAGEDARGEDA